MKKKWILILFVVCLFFMGIGFWWFIEKNRYLSDGEESSHMEKKIRYVCPMHPQIVSDRMGTCPICGMNLVLVGEEKEDYEKYGEHAEEDYEGEEDYEEKENYGEDRHGEVGQGEEEHKERVHKKHMKWANRYDQDQKKKGEKGETHISKKEGQGRSTKKEGGDHGIGHQVPRGHTPFKLSFRRQQMIGVKIGKVKRKKLFKSIRAPGRVAFDPELYTAQSEYLEALKQWKRVKDSPITVVKENTRQMIRSSKIRLEVLGLSDDQIRLLEKKGSQSEGLLVSGKGEDHWIYADVFEMDLPYIKKGLSTEIKATFLQGEVLLGEVISVDRVINPDTRTAKVRIQLLKKNPLIRPESYVSVTIFAPLGEQTAIPLEALMDTGRETFVFVKKGKGYFEPRKVILFFETDDEAAIKRGLTPGEDIVIGGNFMLDSESRLKSVIQSGSPKVEHTH